MVGTKLPESAWHGDEVRSLISVQLELWCQFMLPESPKSNEGTRVVLVGIRLSVSAIYLCFP